MLVGDDVQTQEKLAKALCMSCQCIYKRLHVMKKIQKIEKWVSHEQTDRCKIEESILKFCFCDIKKEFFFCIGWLRAMRNGSISGILNAKACGFYLMRQQFQLYDKTDSETMLCVWWDHTGVVYSELLKPGGIVNEDRYRQQLINLNDALRT